MTGTSHGSGVNKLYIVLQSKKPLHDLPGKKEPFEKWTHPNIICDVCDKNICGFRFKCMQCPDYDLCTDCIAFGYHPEHYMVRMTEPLDLSNYDVRRLAHHMRKFTGVMKKATEMSHGRDDETRRRSHRGSGRRGCPMFNASVDGNISIDPSVIVPLTKFVSQIFVGLQEPCQGQKESRDQRRDPSTEAATEATEDPQREAVKHSFSQLLKIFEDNIPNLTQFLDPLGINVVLTADNDRPATNGEAAADKAQAEASDAPSTSGTAKKFPGEGKRLRDNDIAAELPVPRNDNSEFCPIPPLGKAASPKGTIEEDDWSEIKREELYLSPAPSSASSVIETKQVCDW